MNCRRLVMKSSNMQLKVIEMRRLIAVNSASLQGRLEPDSIDARLRRGEHP